MILESTADPLQLWQNAERYLTLGARGYSPFSTIMEVSERYRPECAEHGFALHSFWIPIDQGSYRINSPSSPLHETYNRLGAVLLPVHPDVLHLRDLYSRQVLESAVRGPRFDVVPSANARTVFVERIDGLPVEPHFLKLHCPLRISRFVRPLCLDDVEHQFWTIRQLERIGLPVLSDVGAGVLGSERNQAWGFLLRDSRVTNGRLLPYTIPLFALYSRDIRHPEHPPLLAQLYRPQIARTVLESITRELVRVWIWSLRESGCVLELHGQNALFRFSSTGESWEIAYRDGDVQVDLSMLDSRTSAEVPRTVEAIGRDVRVPRDQLLSLAYDTFLGHHCLAYLSRTAHQLFGLDIEFIPRVTRDAFLECGGRQLGLPPTTFAFEDKLYPGDRFKLVTKGETPMWR